MYDLIVVGGGPAGVTAALRASELGAQVALVERGRLGGTCTNDGCVPTRVLAKAARLMRESAQLGTYGIEVSPAVVNFPEVIKRTQQVVYTIQEKKQLIKHLQEYGVTTLDNTGNARFLDPHTLTLPDGRTLQGKKFILAAGGHPRRLNFPGAEHTLTHSDVWTLKKLPASVVIVGASATGCQLASVFAAFGSAVWLLELAPRILPLEDPAISEAMTQAFTERGIQIITGLQGIDRLVHEENPGTPAETLHYRHGGQTATITAEAVILAVGWPGNLEPLALPVAGVETQGNYIRVDEYLRTTARHIYAAGDITGKMMLVQTSSYEASIAAENAVAGDRLTYRPQVVPHGGFTDPEYGSVGMTESQARARSEASESQPNAIVVATASYAELDRAVIDGRTEGLCKLIIDRQDLRILGTHVVGEQALEIVHLVAAGMVAGMTVDQLAALEIAYPTFTAVVGIAARKALQQVGGDPRATQWRNLGKPGLVEWERKD